MLFLSTVLLTNFSFATYKTLANNVLNQWYLSTFLNKHTTTKTSEQLGLPSGRVIQNMHLKIQRYFVDWASETCSNLCTFGLKEDKCNWKKWFISRKISKYANVEWVNYFHWHTPSSYGPYVSWVEYWHSRIFNYQLLAKLNIKMLSSVPTCLPVLLYLIKTTITDSNKIEQTQTFCVCMCKSVLNFTW